MRIGLFTDTFVPDLNGVANSTNILFHELRKHGHDAYVIAPGKGRGFAEWNEDHTVLRLAGIQVKQLYGYVVTSPLHLNALNEVRALHLDVIHAQTEFGVGIFARICARELDIPLVSTYHTTYEDYTHYVNIFNSRKFDEQAKKAVAALSRLYGNTSIEVIAPSVKTRDLLLKYKVRSDIHVVPTGLELDKFDPAHEDHKKTKQIRETYGAGENEKMLIYVGRIAEEKSLDLVIDGFADAVKKGFHGKFLVVGDGPDREKLAAKAKDLGIVNTVHFAGPKPSDEVPDYYRAADAFVSASLSETQGMTFIEAMASGLPLLARYDEVLDNLLIDGKTGWFFKDASDLSDKLMYFDSLDEKAEQQLKQNSLAQVRPQSSTVFYERAMKVYEEAISIYEHMMIIADVQVRDDVVHLYLTNASGKEKNEIRLTMTLDDYFNSGMRRGARISDSQIREIQAKEEGAKAYERCLRKIASKDYTTKEIYDWLTKNTSCDIETINSIVDKLESHGYLDDERYCTDSITRMKLALFGEDHIRRELIRKGISPQLVDEKLKAQKSDENEEEELALKYAEKTASSIRNTSVRMKKKKLKDKLLARGYSSDSADRVIRTMDFSEDERNELDALRKCAAGAKKRYEKKYSDTRLRNTIYRYCAAQGFESEDIYAILDEMDWSRE